MQPNTMEKTQCLQQNKSEGWIQNYALILKLHDYDICNTWLPCETKKFQPPIAEQIPSSVNAQKCFKT